MVISVANLKTRPGGTTVDLRFDAVNNYNYITIQGVHQIWKGKFPDFSLTKYPFSLTLFSRVF